MNPSAEIDAVLQRYFDALYESDADKLGGVMHPQAIYATPDEQPLLLLTMDEYLPRVTARESPMARGEPRRDVIEAVDLAGRNTAVARVRCSIANRDFVDFLSLVRERREWRIIAKVFHFEQREE